MKITEVRACQPPCDSPADWRTSLGQMLVAIDTDAGITGYGVGGGGASAIHIIRTVLRDYLLSKDTEPVESHWNAMYQATLPFGRKGVAIMALSGVDLALWDLRGKAAKQSVAQLLGGPSHAAMPTYTTVWDDIPDALIGQHSAFKIHLGEMHPHAQPLSQGERGDRLHHFLDIVTRARKRVGPAAKLMIDAWMKWDIAFTLRFAEKAAPLGIDWIEEPLPPDDLTGYAELVRNCPIPIAGGEHEFTAAAFAEIIERRLHHVVQPDVCWCGGMTELVKIYALAKKHGIRVCPHRGAEIWGLHALAALDPEPLAESGRPWMTWVGGQPAIQDGMIGAPTGPGFGAVIDEAVFV